MASMKNSEWNMPFPMQTYLIGSLRNPRVAVLGNKMRKAGINVFDDWFAAGPEADDKWQEYEQARGRLMHEALKGAHAQDVFEFDKRNLDASDTAVLVLPAGKSGHLELGYMVGRGKRAYILLDGEPDRFDVMYNFATGVFIDEDALVRELLK
ncbi:MAG TPA: hypothetical protein VIY48_05130 [Candidatus Paceibacterota bacterium]